MGSTSDHIDLANRCETTLRFLLTDPRNHPEWITTVAFYKALHVVEAVLVKRGTTGGSHSTRLNHLKSMSEYRGLHHALRTLWSASMVARYLVLKTTPEDRHGREYPSFSAYMPPRKVVEDIVGSLLVQCENEALRFLDSDQKAALVRVNRSELPVI